LDCKPYRKRCRRVSVRGKSTRRYLATCRPEVRESPRRTVESGPAPAIRALPPPPRPKHERGLGCAPVTPHLLPRRPAPQQGSPPLQTTSMDARCILMSFDNGTITASASVFEPRHLPAFRQTVFTAPMRRASGSI